MARPEAKNRSTKPVVVDISADYEKAGATGQKHFCAMPPPLERVMSPNVNGRRLELIQAFNKKWVSGTTLSYYFFDKATDGRTVRLNDGSTQFRAWASSNNAEKDVVRNAFKAWKSLGIGLEFKEVTTREDAQIRISFERGDGFWSYIGRDILEFPPNDRTMNFGVNLATYPDGADTALHEIGHTLGFPHEHQNPNAGIVWNEEAVYAALAAAPNRWSRDKTFQNIIRKIPTSEVRGSNWDPNSVMHYPFEPGMIKEPTQFASTGIQPAGGLSALDKDYIRQFYPTLTKNDYKTLVPFQSEPLSLAAGQQANFYLTPTRTRSYTIQTFGESDTVMVLYEDAGSAEPIYIAGDDDGGQDYNAKLALRLVKDRRYILRVRLYYAETPGETAVMVW